MASQPRRSGFVSGWLLTWDGRGFVL